MLTPYAYRSARWFNNHYDAKDWIDYIEWSNEEVGYDESYPHTMRQRLLSSRSADDGVDIS